MTLALDLLLQEDSLINHTARKIVENVLDLLYADDIVLFSV